MRASASCAARLSGIQRPRASEAAQKLAARSGSSRPRSTPAAAARAAASRWPSRPTKSPKLAGQILGMQLKTKQTGPEGQKVRRLLIEEGADIKKEYYVAVAHRPGDAEGRADGLERRRHGHRAGGPRHAGEDPEGLHRPARGPRPTPKPPSSPPASASRQRRCRRRSTCWRSSTPATWRPTRR